MATRKMVVSLRSDGYARVLCKQGTIEGVVSQNGSRWYWNIWHTTAPLKNVAYGFQDQQWMAYGEMLSKIFELTA